MTWVRTYTHTLAIGFDDLWAAILFNRNDITISSLCWLKRVAPMYPEIKQRLDNLDLRGWQHAFLLAVGNGLEFIWPGHCNRARLADRERGRGMRALLTMQGDPA